MTDLQDALIEQRDALSRLSFVNGPGERLAALLALLLTPGSEPERRAWAEATAGVAVAARLAADVERLTPSARLPVFEALLERSRSAALPERQTLVETARGVMAADGQVSPLDRLRWLTLRHRLGEAPLAPPGAALGRRAGDMMGTAAAEFAILSAFLARIVPEAADDGGIGAAGQAWHGRALAPWDSVLAPRGGAAALCRVPDGEQLRRALRSVQGLSWMQRPVLLRAWIDALPAPGPAVLGQEACDALRLAATLLDAPLPPSLAARYTEPGWA
ncbi:hypothetical protein [Methylibium sp.]|uniref:hypothetical protein n=1 Tax=Methylibium sp. TaxID=2067992 RepID=UPI003D0A404E